jgi:AGZA family xanthine/uracil permease-like MFS transporter
VVTFHPIRHILAAQDWRVSQAGFPQAVQFVLTLFTFVYVDILDLTGTIYSMARFCGAIDEDTQDFEGSTVAYLVDALGITLGSLFGSPPVTAFVESGAGISEGGTYGLHHGDVLLCLNLFCSNICKHTLLGYRLHPHPCRRLGAMVARAVTDINRRYMGDSVPAFLTLAIMPFTFSIAYGLITYVRLRLSDSRFRLSFSLWLKISYINIKAVV